jgi:hypothetical protein
MNRYLNARNRRLGSNTTNQATISASIANQSHPATHKNLSLHAASHSRLSFRAFGTDVSANLLLEDGRGLFVGKRAVGRCTLVLASTDL